MVSRFSSLFTAVFTTKEFPSGTFGSGADGYHMVVNALCVSVFMPDVTFLPAQVKVKRTHPTCLKRIIIAN